MALHSAVAGYSPDGLYWHFADLVWVFIFAFFYLVDFYHLQGYLRWSLILLFMFLKTGFIIAIFMHVSWERLALKYLLFVPWQLSQSLLP